jgi:hypothetical protein
MPATTASPPSTASAFGRSSAHVPRLDRSAAVHQPARHPGPALHAAVPARGARHAEELDAEAEALFREGIEAKHHDDAYILSTVFFAAVLFFASVSMRLGWWRLRVGVFALGTVMLGIGLTWVLSQPSA